MSEQLFPIPEGFEWRGLSGFWPEQAERLGWFRRPAKIRDGSDGPIAGLTRTRRTSPQNT